MLCIATMWIISLHALAVENIQPYVLKIAYNSVISPTPTLYYRQSSQNVSCDCLSVKRDVSLANPPRYTWYCMLDTLYSKPVAVEQKYDWGGGGGGGGGGAGVRGCETADYPRKVSACEGQKLGG